MRKSVALALLQTLIALPILAEPVRVSADWFACHEGKYAFVLSNHYPSLFKIGRHKVTELESVATGQTTVKKHRVQYIGMRMDVLVSSENPTRYQLLEAEVFSRRWSIGRLSVGENPWRWGREASLSQTDLTGEIELLGTSDSVSLQLDAGRILRATYKCKSIRPV